MRFFREGLYGVIAAPLARIGLTSDIPPITRSDDKAATPDAPAARSSEA